MSSSVWFMGNCPFGLPQGPQEGWEGAPGPCPLGEAAWGSELTLGSGSSPTLGAVPRVQGWAAQPSRRMRFPVITGIARDTQASLSFQGAWEGGEMRRMGEDRGITAAGAPQLGLRMYARERSTSITPGGQIHRLGAGGTTCEEPAIQHSRRQIPDQAASVPGHRTSAPPESPVCSSQPALLSCQTSYPTTSSILPKVPQDAPQQPQDQGSPQPGPSDGSRVLPLGSASPAPEQGLPLPQQPPSPSR